MVHACEGRAASIRSWFGVLAVSSVFLSPHPAPAQIRPIELEGFIVTGTPVPRLVGTETSHVTILDGEELRSRGVARVAEALAEVPGLVVVQGGSYGAVTSTFFRGAESDHMKVLVDGVEVNQAGGGFDFSGLLTADVERIEVARGPASALYGSDAMAGVINILTRRGRGPLKGSMFLAAGSFGRLETSADLHGGGPATSYSLSASRLSTDGILEFNNRFRSTALSGAVFITPDENTRIGLLARLGDRIYHFPTDGTGTVVDRNAFTFGDEVTLGLEAERRIADWMELKGMVRSYGWNGGSDDKVDGPEDTAGYFGYSSLDTFQRTSVDLRTNLALPRSTTLTLGGEVEDEEQRSHSESLSEFGPSNSRSRSQRSNRGYYAHLTTQGRGWSGNLGGRVEHNGQYGDFFTWQAGLSYAFGVTRTRLRGQVGKGMKEPAFLETITSAFTVGNPELKPERSLVWEVGAEQALGSGGGQVAITWFRQELTDLIQYTFMAPEPGGPNYFNVAEARSWGLEVAGRLPLGPAILSGGYTFLDTEVVDAGFDVGEGATFVEGEALVRRPRHQVSLDATYRFSRGGLNAGVRRVGTRADRDFGAWPAVPVELKAYTLVGLGGEFVVREPGPGVPGFTLAVRMENLLDQSYQEVFGFRAPGRAFLLGGRVTVGG